MQEPTAFVIITRHRVDDLEAWMPQARAALAPLASQATCLGGEIGASIDDPGLAVVITRWASVGDFRRAMSAYEVKLHTLPLLYSAIDEPTSFEVLHHRDAQGATDRESDRASDADEVRLGEAAAATVEPRLGRSSDT